MSFISTVSEIANVTVSTPTSVVSIGIYEEVSNAFVIGTIIVDGVSSPNESTKAFVLNNENHIFDIIPPAGHEFVRWEVHEFPIDDIPERISTIRPLSQNIDSPIWIFARLRLALIETVLTISAPSVVDPGEDVSFMGILTRSDTGEALAGQTITLEHPLGTIANNGITDSNGNYNIAVIAPTVEATYQYRVSFAGTVTLGFSQSATKDIGVGVPSNLPLLVVLGAAAYFLLK